MLLKKKLLAEKNCAIINEFFFGLSNFGTEKVKVFKYFF